MEESGTNENLGCWFGAILVGGRINGEVGGLCRVGMAVSIRGGVGGGPQDTTHPALVSELLR